MGSCVKRLDKRVSLWRMDKIPYGTKYAYENLPSLFPKAVIRAGDHFPVLFGGENAVDTLQALIIVSPLFAPEPDEMRSVLSYAASGNQVFISCLRIDDSVLSLLHLKIAEDGPVLKDSGAMMILNPSNGEWIKYTYPGFSNDSYFEEIDTGFATVMGKNSQGRPDFIRMSYSHGGSVFVHLDPFAFTNFFLLHKKNKSYYDVAFSYLSRETGIVQWSDYFRYRKKGQAFSAFHFLLSNRSFKWAFWITVMLILLLVLIESKPKQRLLAEIPPLKNASEDFVKTIGRLYFQQKNNHNLAVKMVTAFLENIRSTYNLPTSVLNEEFAHKLSFRTGRPLAEIILIIQMIHESRLRQDITDQQLMDLHQQINQFSKPVF